MLADDGDALGELGVGGLIGVREDDGAGVGDLVAEKLAEVLHIHLALAGVHDRRERIELRLVRRHALDGADHVAEFADARRLDQDAVGGKLGQHLFERAPEITDQTATDAARIHLGNFDPGVLHKAAVDADLSEFVFDQDELFALERLLDEFFDERGFSRAEKARENIDFGQAEHSLSSLLFVQGIFLRIYYIPL